MTFSDGDASSSWIVTVPVGRVIVPICAPLRLMKKVSSSSSSVSSVISTTCTTDEMRDEKNTVPLDVRKSTSAPAAVPSDVAQLMPYVLPTPIGCVR